MSSAPSSPPESPHVTASPPGRHTELRLLLGVGVLALTVIATAAVIFVGIRKSQRARSNVEALATAPMHTLPKALEQVVRLGARAVPELVRIRRDHGPERVMAYTAALSGIAARDATSRKAVHDLLHHPDLRVRVMAAGFWIQDANDRKALVAGLSAKDDAVRFEAAFKLNALDEAFDNYHEIVATLLDHLDDATPRLTTASTGFELTTVGDLALTQLRSLTGINDKVAIRAWWQSPETRKRSNARLLLDALGRNAEVTRVPPKALPKVRAWLEAQAAAAAEKSARPR